MMELKHLTRLKFVTLSIFDLFCCLKIFGDHRGQKTPIVFLIFTIVFPQKIRLEFCLQCLAEKFLFAEGPHHKFVGLQLFQWHSDRTWKPREANSVSCLLWNKIFSKIHCFSSYINHLKDNLAR